MAISLNKVTLIGIVSKEPEIKVSKDGNNKEIANLTVTTSEVWKEKVTGAHKEKTEFHKVVIFNEVFINVVKNYIKLGSKVYIEGCLQTRKWVDQAGNDKYSTEIVLTQYKGNLIFFSSNNDHYQDQDKAFEAQKSLGVKPKSMPVKDEGKEQGSIGEFLDDDLPF